MTHEEVVARAVKWLKTRMRCPVVLSEYATVGNEQPDAIGWKYTGESFLLEAKISRADFLQDKKKLWRTGVGALGQHRYYIAPPGLIRTEEIPEDWGLLEVRPKTIKIVKAPRKIIQDSSGMKAEVAMLVSAVRRPLFHSGDDSHVHLS